MLLPRFSNAAVSVVVVLLTTVCASPFLNDGLKVELKPGNQVEERQSDSTCVCGVGKKKRIVGGQFSEINSYPWMVGVFWVSGDKLFCGGAILNSRYILSASHCYPGVKQDDIYTVLGDYDRNTPNEVVSQMMGIQSIVIHEQYGVKSRVDSDIALLKTSRIITFRENIQPICLPTPGSNFLGEVGIAAGWGTTKFGGDESMILREVNIPLIQDAICKANFTINYNPDTMMCGGYMEGGKDACQGDSGGPLFLEDDVSYSLIGVISYGRGCATKGYPGVYTRVTKFLPWIKRKTSDAEKCSKPRPTTPQTSTCGVANFQRKRVVGGSDVSPNTYPWTAIIIQKNPRGAYRLRCGATLISDQWLVTTALCVSGVDSSTLSVVLGEHDISRFENREVQRFIGSIVVNPDYNSEYTITDDIALVKLNIAVTTSSIVRPICLPPKSWSSLTMEGIEGVATGWGSISDAGLSPNVQQEVFLKIVTNSFCSWYYGPAITNKVICAGTVAGENICTNDFGGQLSVFTDESKQYMLAGVSSFIYAAGGCSYNAPAGFMRVTFYLDWISKTTGIQIT